MHNMVAIGICSLCGGNVMVHKLWGSIVPDTPTCYQCGAKKEPYSASKVSLPVITMTPVVRENPMFSGHTNLTIQMDTRPIYPNKPWGPKR